jgi:hypothetical protein
LEKGLIGAAKRVTEFASATLLPVFMMHRTGGASIDRTITLLVSVHQRDTPQRQRRRRNGGDLKRKPSGREPAEMTTKSSHQLCYGITVVRGGALIQMELHR